MGATPIDNNDADGKSGKLYGWLLIIRCTRQPDNVCFYIRRFVLCYLSSTLSAAAWMSAKKSVIATIAVTDYRGVTSYIKTRFSTFSSDLKAL